MSDEHRDPSGNTEAFRAFAQSAEPEPAGKPPMLLIMGGVAALAVVLVVIFVLILA